MWRTRGINAHTTIIVDIIDTMLRRRQQSAIPPEARKGAGEGEGEGGEGMHVQRLEARDAELGREDAGDEREDGGAGLADARDVAHRAREEPAREDLRAVVHEDRVHGPEQHPHERDRDRVLDERRHDPYRHFEPGRVRAAVSGGPARGGIGRGETHWIAMRA